MNPLDASLAIGGLRIDTDSTVEGAIEIDAPQEIELGPRETIIVSSSLNPKRNANPVK